VHEHEAAGAVGALDLARLEARLAEQRRLLIAETTALGAAYAAGLAVGFWRDLDELRAMDRAGRRWEPRMDEPTRTAGVARWHKGVERTLGWVEPGV